MTNDEKLMYEQFLLTRKNAGFNLMSTRAGVVLQPEFEGHTIDGINDIAHRLNQRGGFAQQSRMIKDKRKTLDKAVLYSYQGAQVKKVGLEESIEPARALINPNKLKPDYDDKILSVGHEHNFKPGDVFEWVGTDTHWLIYLQDLTELAYFRGDIRKCSYEIKWEDENGKHSTFAAIRGPVETKINYIQKQQISVDTPNHSLHILMPQNEETLKYFKRYSKFYLQNKYGTDPICWRVEAIDWISMPGVLEINAVEYYSNTGEDDVQTGIVGGLIVEEINPNPESIEQTIVGETFIKPKKEYTYTYTGLRAYNWRIDEKYPIVYTINDKTITLKWTSSYSGQFILRYGNINKTIVVESLF